MRGRLPAARGGAALLTAVAALAATATPGTAVTATAVGSVCAGTVTWSFSPPLGETAGTGSVTQTFDGVCGLGVVGATSGPPPAAGEFHNLFGVSSGPDTGGYSGDCLLAIVTINDMRYVLVDSSVATGERRDTTSTAGTNVGVNRLTPNQPCDVSTASGDWVVASAAVNVF